MKPFTDLSIGRRLALGFAGAVLMVAALLGLVDAAADRITEVRHRQTTIIAPRAETAAHLESSVLYTAVLARAYLMHPGEEQRTRFAQAVKEMQAGFEKLAQFGVEEDDERLLAAMTDLARVYERSIEQLTARANQPASLVLEGEAVAAREALLKTVREFGARQQAKSQATRGVIASALSQLQRSALMIGLGILAALAAIGYFTAQSVRVPAQTLLAATRRLAVGEFEPALSLGRPKGTPPGNNELKELADAFARMAAELREREQRLQEKNEELQAQNEEIQAQQEELQAQSEEIQAQNEELQSQNEELQAQGEELQAQGDVMRRTVERLAASEERYAGLFTNLSEGAALNELLLDAEGRAVDFRVLAVNPAFEAATGLRSDQVLGRTVKESVPDIEGFWLERFAKVVQTGVPARFDAFSAAMGRHFQVSAFALGRLRFGVVFMDVSEQKKADEALRDADKNKTEFLAMLSHELRNPLAPIKNSLYVLERKPADPAQTERARTVIARQVDQLTRLVEDLLDITRISRGKVQLQRAGVDLSKLLRQAVEDHAAEFTAHGIGFTTEITDAPVIVMGDSARIAQVIGNLLQNAAKFTPAGGQVRLTLENEAGKVRIRVVDTGAGIDEPTLQRLFQPFMQADVTLARTSGGLGLGLALAKGLVEMHGGTISAQSRGRNQGTEFVVELPTSDVRLVERPKEAAAPRVRVRVLIIEDNMDAADSLKEAIELGGHTVEVAYAAADGISKAREAPPDVLLCDIGLPDIDGHQVARIFRDDARLKSAYLVALTGYALPEDKKRARESGFDAHLAKPPRLEKLEEILAGAARGVRG